MKKRTILKLSAMALAAVVAAQTTVAVSAAPVGGFGAGEMQQGPQQGPGIGDTQQGLQQGPQQGPGMGDMQQGSQQGPQQEPTVEPPEDAPQVPEGETVQKPDGLPDLPEDADESGSGQHGQRQDGQEGKCPPMPGNMQGGSAQPGEPMELPEGALNIGAVEDAIRSMEDGDAKTNLKTLLEAYVTALKDPTEDTADEDVIIAAQSALQEAIDEAGLTISDEMQKPDDELAVGGRTGGKENSAQMMPKETPQNPTDSEEAEDNFFQRTASSLGNRLESFYNWLKELFE